MDAGTGVNVLDSEGVSALRGSVYGAVFLIVGDIKTFFLVG